MRHDIPDHPEIRWALRTGYPSWKQEQDEPQEFDEDGLYEERRDAALWGDEDE